MANVGESGESEQTRLANEGEFSESDQFFKKTILASTRICQKWRISGKYSNSLNSPASSHCLVKKHNLSLLLQEMILSKFILKTHQPALRTPWCEGNNDSE